MVRLIGGNEHLTIQSQGLCRTGGKIMERIGRLPQVASLLGITIPEELLKEIENGLTLADIIENPRRPLPDMLDIDDVILLWVYLENRRDELDKYVQQFLGSIPPDKRPPENDFEAWKQFRADAYDDSFEQKIAMMQLIRIAKTFGNWLYIINFAKHECVKIISAIALRDKAQGEIQEQMAGRKLEEVGIGSLP